MSDIIVPLGLLGLGLYVIMNINNDDNYKYVKNSGSLEMNNTINPSDMKDNYTLLDDNNNNNNKNNYNENIGDYNFFNTDNTKTINDQINKNNNLNVNDLLPKTTNNEWNWDVPTQNVTLEESNLLSSAVKKIGNNTQGNSLKNPSYDIRGNIPNPKFQVSPFNNSSYDPDTNIKSFN